MQSGEPIHIGCVNVGALVEQLDDLVLVAGKASGEEDASRAKLDPSTVFVAGRWGGAIGVGLLPALELLRPLHHRRVAARVQRRHLEGSRSLFVCSPGIKAATGEARRSRARFVIVTAIAFFLYTFLLLFPLGIWI